MFDRQDYPYSETFVREAIQNSLDARRDSDQPVFIRFRFHEERLGNRAAYLKGLMEHRERVGLRSPQGWSGNVLTWLTVQDFNTKGLLGPIDTRTSDFWNYWLNFGLSNKEASQRGGRGIGRVTFLIASQIQAVLGITRPFNSSSIAACAMGVLRAGQYGNDFKSTHAYMAEAEAKYIYTLHSRNEFHEGLEERFCFESFTQDPELTGLALAIPYPHEDLSADRIISAAVDHFAPAILCGALVVEVDDYRLDGATIAELAPFFSGDVKSKGVGGDLQRYLSLIKVALDSEPAVLSLDAPKLKVSELRETVAVQALQEKIEAGEAAVLRIEFPLSTSQGKQRVELRAVVSKAPYGKAPIDRLFREGMSLPDVRASNPAELDTIMLVGEGPLATYLNLCEGKAHLDLLESKEIRQKLEDKGFGDGVSVKRFVKLLPAEIRALLAHEITEPDESVFEGFFSVPDPSAPPRRTGGAKPIPPPPPPPPPPPATPSPVKVVTLSDGFRLNANEHYGSYPVTVRVTIAYADGSASPRWSEHDFRPTDLRTSEENCEAEFAKNRLFLRQWKSGSSVEVTGFDHNRELDLRIRITRDAPES